MQGGKAKLDSAGINMYNVNKISNYALSSYLEDRFDEAYVEYRVNKMRW